MREREKWGVYVFNLGIFLKKKKENLVIEQSIFIIVEFRLYWIVWVNFDIFC